MALNYSTSKIADDPSLTDENGYWIPAFQSICFATMEVGINEIKHSNYQEFYRRYLMARYAMGQNEPYLTLQMIRKFIGLATNASTKTVSQFNKDVLATMQEKAMRKIKAEIELGNS